MDTPISLLATILPLTLLLLAAVVLHHAGSEENAPRQVLLLFEIFTLALLVGLTIFQFMPTSFQSQIGWISSLSIPIIFGTVIAIMIYLPQLGKMKARQRVPVILLGLAIAGLLAYYLREPSALLMVLPSTIFILLAGWLIGKQPSRWIWLVTVVLVAMWFIFNGYSVYQLTEHWPAIGILIGILFTALPALTVAVMALFTYSGLKMLIPSVPTPGQTPPQPARIEGILRLLAVLLMLACLVYSTFWTSVWDSTSDGLGGVMLLELVLLAAVACGLILGLRATGWARFSGIVFPAIVIAAVTISFYTGSTISFPLVTEQRAARVASALERFHLREGRYPQNLSELFPRDLLIIPQPVMFRGEGWCYQGTANEYQLAAFFHEYFGLPVSFKVYANAGDPTNQLLPCTERLADMQARYDWTKNIYDSSNQLAQLPTPPVSNEKLSVPREVISPLFASTQQLLPGTWSPENQWWYFSEPQPDGQQVNLFFVDAVAAQVCPVEQPFLLNASYGYDAAAWLPGDRLLYVNGSGQAIILTPCQTDFNSVDAPKGVTFTKVVEKDSSSGQVLLQSQETYWLLSPTTLKPVRIQGVQPSTVEAHRDNASFSPDGSKLAISHLNSRDPKDGITLFIVDTLTTRVTLTHQMNLASQQSAPFIEWVSENALLINGPTSWIMLDVSSVPPRQIDVIRDLFQLDLTFPDQISSSASLMTKDQTGYHLAVWANHPHNQSLYVYHSEDGQISTYQPEGQTALVIFPDGKWTLMTQMGDVNPSLDQVTLIWPDSSSAPVALTITGHLPRGYPMLCLHYLHETGRLVVSSSNGVSLLNTPGGELLHFWRNSVGRDTSPSLIISPDGKSGLLLAFGEGLYTIPLP